MNYTTQYWVLMRKISIVLQCYKCVFCMLINTIQELGN